jgi:hypothetical protein
MTWSNVVDEGPQVLGATVQNLVAWAIWSVAFVHLRHMGFTYDDYGGNMNTCWIDNNETITSSLLAVRGEYPISADYAVSLFAISFTCVCSGFSLVKFWHIPTLPRRVVIFPLSKYIALLAEHLAFFYQETFWNIVTAYFIWISLQGYLRAAFERAKHHTLCVLSLLCNACGIN